MPITTRVNPTSNFLNFARSLNAIEACISIRLQVTSEVLLEVQGTSTFSVDGKIDDRIGMQPVSLVGPELSLSASPSVS